MHAAARVAAPASPAEIEVAAARRRMLVGTWQDHYQGTRTMTLKDDGTATMVVELNLDPSTFRKARGVSPRPKRLLQ